MDPVTLTVSEQFGLKSLSSACYYTPHCQQCICHKKPTAELYITVDVHFKGHH